MFTLGEGESKANMRQPAEAFIIGCTVCSPPVGPWSMVLKQVCKAAPEVFLFQGIIVLLTTRENTGTKATKTL